MGSEFFFECTSIEKLYIEANSGNTRNNPTVFIQGCLLSAIQCCGARTGTTGTVTFCLSGTGTGTGMNYGSGSKTGFGSGSNIKCNKKSKYLKFSGTEAASAFFVSGKQ
jgi:hypothetical protein